MNVCRPKKKSPATQPRFWLPRTTPGFPARNIYRASSAQIQKSSVGLQTPTPAATQLQPCIARTSQLHPFSSVSSSALGHAPPTDSHRRSLAGASTHRFGSSRPARVVVALLHRRAISSCGGRFSGAGGTCEGWQAAPAACQPAAQWGARGLTGSGSGLLQARSKVTQLDVVAMRWGTSSVEGRKTWWIWPWRRAPPHRYGWVGEDGRHSLRRPGLVLSSCSWPVQRSGAAGGGGDDGAGAVIGRSRWRPEPWSARCRLQHHNSVAILETGSSSTTLSSSWRLAAAPWLFATPGGYNSYGSLFSHHLFVFR
jgi:hypothetical protein